MDAYPLVFLPIFKPKLWGGRKLGTLLGKALPPQEPVGESWEVADLEDAQSVVAAGPAAGRALGDLVRDWKSDLLGEAKPVEGRFPLLLKFLDAAETLSVQVHPDEDAARRHGGTVRVKHEAWYVVDAEPGATIYRGLQPGFDLTAFREAIAAGRAESVLHRVPVRKGHVYYLPSGTIHALGGGVVVAEVQTPSDVTYRLFDWNRVDESTGSPRQLHVDEALACAKPDRGPFPEEEPHHLASVWTTVTTLIRCPSFAMDRVRMVEGVEQDIPLDRCFVIWMMLEGTCQITCEGSAGTHTVQRGQTVLLPAALKKPKLKALSACLWLEVSVPLPSTLAGYDRPPPDELRGLSRTEPAPVQINLPPNRAKSSGESAGGADQQS